MAFSLTLRSSRRGSNPINCGMSPIEKSILLFAIQEKYQFIVIKPFIFLKSSLNVFSGTSNIDDPGRPSSPLIIATDEGNDIFSL